MSLRSRSRAAAASECAPGARRSTRGPYGAAGGWRKVRRMAGRDAGQFFAGTGTCRRKTPEPARAPGAHGWAQGAPSGCRFLLVTSPLDKQRRSNSGRGSGTKRFVVLMAYRHWIPAFAGMTSKAGACHVDACSPHSSRPSRATTTPRIHPPPIPLR